MASGFKAGDTDSKSISHSLTDTAEVIQRHTFYKGNMPISLKGSDPRISLLQYKHRDRPYKQAKCTVTVHHWNHRCAA